MEFFEGQECKKMEASSTYKGQVYKSIQWRSKPLHGFVVKTQDVQGQWSAEYQNIKLGDQPASLFELPMGYNRIAFSRDWRSVVEQIEFAGGLSQGIEIARKAGLSVEQGAKQPDYQSVSFIDAVEARFSNIDTFHCVRQINYQATMAAITPLYSEAVLHTSAANSRRNMRRFWCTYRITVLAIFRSFRLEFSNRSASRSMECAKLWKANVGEVAERLKAAVC